MNTRNLNTSEIVTGNNDRTKFNTVALEELASSIATNGLAQPITVRPIGICECGYRAYAFPSALCPTCGSDEITDTYEIVAGERRFRAVSQILHRDTIPAIIREITDEQAAAIMLTENVARTDLDPIDEARAYASRIDAFDWSVKDCAEQAGVSEVRVRFRLKLLALREDLQALVRSGDLALGYARILADTNLDNDRQLIALGRLRDNPSPTPAWFRRTVSQLKEEQAQVSLFDLPLINGQAIPMQTSLTLTYTEPPTPATANPPRQGNTIKTVIQNQIRFWKEAAVAWNHLGKPFKRQECEAAATALSQALSAI